LFTIPWLIDYLSPAKPHIIILMIFEGKVYF